MRGFRPLPAFLSFDGFRIGQSGGSALVPVRPDPPLLSGTQTPNLAFEHVLRPRVELAFPELAADRVAREVRKAEKRERKRQKRTKRSRT